MRTLVRPHWLLVGLIATVAACLVIAASWAPAQAHDGNGKAASVGAVDGAPLSCRRPARPRRPGRTSSSC